MNKVVKILMERDQVDEKYATALVKDTKRELETLENPFEFEDVIWDNLGLEPDYLIDILDI